MGDFSSLGQCDFIARPAGVVCPFLTNGGLRIMSGQARHGLLQTASLPTKQARRDDAQRDGDC